MDDNVGLPAPPRRIKRLDDSTVNRIAAGEIIQRPVNALKEMVENSLDAGSTQIHVTVKDAGLKMLQIQDNGHGIQIEDLPLLCERHATSKLEQFEDLASLSTLGFRGEALASISFVAHLTVTTMTRNAAHGMRISYHDGLMEEGGPKPCAAVPGTTILVEDLFYNSVTRRKALKSGGEEYSRILDMLSRYAVYKAGVAISCKKAGEARPQLHTLAGASRIDNIRTIYGGAVARSLMPFRLSLGGPGGEGSPIDPDGPNCVVQGYLSGPDYGGKKTVFILFINGRPVDCAPLKRALESAYSSVLPASSRPFIFFDVEMPGSQVDVNLHPTKREVGFLHQDALIDALASAVQEQLLSCNQQRTYSQKLLPGASSIDACEGTSGRTDPEATTKREKAGGDYKLVRTDSRAQTMERFLVARPSGDFLPEGSTNPQENPSAAAVALAAAPRRRGGVHKPLEAMGLGDIQPGLALLQTHSEGGLGMAARAVRQNKNPNPGCQLTSIQELLQEVERSFHQGLGEVVKGHIFVGMANSILALLQYGTCLYLVDASALSREMFYQQVLRRFENFSRILIGDTPSIRTLALLALRNPDFFLESVVDGGPVEEVADMIEKLLKTKAELLLECAGVEIDGHGCLTALPAIIDHYVPDLDRLPSLVIRLAQDVDWSDEKSCFSSLAQVLADFYKIQPPLLPRSGETGKGDHDSSEIDEEEIKELLAQDNSQHSAAFPDFADNKAPNVRALDETGNLRNVNLGEEVREDFSIDLLGIQDISDPPRPLTDQAEVVGMGEDLKIEGYCSPGQRSVKRRKLSGSNSLEATVLVPQPLQESNRITEKIFYSKDEVLGRAPKRSLQTREESRGDAQKVAESDMIRTGARPEKGSTDEAAALFLMPRGFDDAMAAQSEDKSSTMESFRKAKGLPHAGDETGEGVNLANGGGAKEAESEGRKQWPTREWTIEHVVFPAMRLFLKPSRPRATDGSMILLTRLEDLYRTFERC
eukprot:jgi/Botrbrau1/3667/Bobra.0008s0002.1